MPNPIPSSHLDLLDRPVAALATVGPDGRPQVSAVWFLYEDDAVKISLNTTRQKTKNLRANPVVDLFVTDESGYRTLEVRGDALVEPDDSYEFAARLGAKYGGADLRAMDGPGETRVVVTVQPSRVNVADLTGAGA